MGRPLRLRCATSATKICTNSQNKIKLHEHGQQNLLRRATNLETTSVSTKSINAQNKTNHEINQPSQQATHLNQPIQEIPNKHTTNGHPQSSHQLITHLLLCHANSPESTNQASNEPIRQTKQKKRKRKHSLQPCRKKNKLCT